MATGEHLATVGVAVVGLAAAIISGMMGYQTGSNAVNKDYVSLAISTLDKKDATPELRKWSVDVLSKLSPVPFDAKLKEELAVNGLTRERVVFRRVEAPKSLLVKCPNLMPKNDSAISAELAQKVVNSYDLCRAKHEFLTDFLSDYNKIIDGVNVKQAKVGLEHSKPSVLPKAAPTH